MPDDAPSFGPRLRALRDAAGWTQARLAEAIGADLRTVQKWESGERSPGWEWVVKMADALGRGLDEFRAGPG